MYVYVYRYVEVPTWVSEKPVLTTYLAENTDLARRSPGPIDIQRRR